METFPFEIICEILKLLTVKEVVCLHSLNRKLHNARFPLFNKITYHEVPLQIFAVKSLEIHKNECVDVSHLELEELTVVVKDYFKMPSTLKKLVMFGNSGKINRLPTDLEYLLCTDFDFTGEQLPKTFKTLVLSRCDGVNFSGLDNLQELRITSESKASNGNSVLQTLHTLKCLKKLLLRNVGGSVILPEFLKSLTLNSCNNLCVVTPVCKLEKIHAYNSQITITNKTFFSGLKTLSIDSITHQELALFKNLKKLYLGNQNIELDFSLLNLEKFEYHGCNLKRLPKNLKWLMCSSEVDLTDNSGLETLILDPPWKNCSVFPRLKILETKNINDIVAPQLQNLTVEHLSSKFHDGFVNLTGLSVYYIEKSGTLDLSNLIALKKMCIFRDYTCAEIITPVSLVSLAIHGGKKHLKLPVFIKKVTLRNCKTVVTAHKNTIVRVKN